MQPGTTRKPGTRAGSASSLIPSQLPRGWSDAARFRVLLQFKQTLFGFLLRSEGVFLELLLEQKRLLLINTRLDRWFTWTERKILGLRSCWLQNASRARKQGGNNSQEWGSGVWPQTWR